MRFQLFEADFTILDLLTKTAIITRAEIRRRALDIRASHFVPPGKIVERQIIRACCDEANWLTIVQAKEKAGDITALQLNSYHKVANGMARRMETELKEIRG